MSDPKLNPPARNAPTGWWRWLIPTFAAIVGGALSFEFGVRASGPWLGLVTAVNGALLCWVLAAGALDALGRRRRRSTPPRAD